MSALARFFNMGGYGLYVWSAYAIAFGVLLLPLWRVVHNKKVWLRHCHMRLQREQNP